MPVGIVFSDVNGSLGVGRYAGPYRYASEFRHRSERVVVIDHMMSFTVDELIQIIQNRVSKRTEWIGISSTFLASSDFDPFAGRVQIREHLQQATSVGLSLPDAEQLFSFIRSIGLQIRIGGARLKHEFENVQWISGQGEPSIFKDFDFNTSQILWDQEDHIFEGEHLPIEIARGCIFKCSFCSYNLNGKKLWEFCKSPSVVEEEMLSNYDQFGTTGYMFADDTYNDSPVKVREYHDMFKRLPFDIEFTTYARLDLILAKWETMDMLAQSGMKSVFFGIESLNPLSGKSIGKGMDPNRVKDGLLRIKQDYPEIIICAGFIAGLPHETIDTLQDTIEWLENSPIDSYSYQVLSMGNQGSDMGAFPEKYGYQFDDNGEWFNQHMHYREAMDIAKTATRGTISAFTFYSRLRNLGYTGDQVRRLTELDKSDILTRTDNRIDNYRNLVL